MKRNKFVIRIELIPQLSDILDSVSEFIEIFKSETKTDLEIIFWYNKSKVLKPVEDKLLSSVKKYLYNYHVDDHCGQKKGIFCDLYFSTDESKASLNNDGYKFYLTYYDLNSFTISLFQLFSFIKAKLNYESAENDNRSNRKQVLPEKIKNKGISVENKTEK